MFHSPLSYPMLVAEILVGRFGKGDPVKATGVGQALLTTSFHGLSEEAPCGFVDYGFYAIVAGWFIGYALQPFADILGFSSASTWLTSFSISSNLVLTFVFFYDS